MDVGKPWNEVAAAFNSADRIVSTEARSDGWSQYRFHVFREERGIIVGRRIKVDVSFSGICLENWDFDFSTPTGYNFGASSSLPYMTGRPAFITINATFTASADPSKVLLPLRYLSEIPNLAAGCYRFGWMRPQIEALGLFTAHERMEMTLWQRETTFKMPEKRNTP